MLNLLSKCQKRRGGADLKERKLSSKKVEHTHLSFFNKTIGHYLPLFILLLSIQ